ncbi:hypothetical protein BCHO_0081 [Bifidobacterium choerinum]|uniref:DUF4357 domain-containing protein n=2 Tax=Bifidobacterium choerinum TaxID=35760 RepID=A0A087AGV1_9BIFI|nr:hypothetical protein BCHO_0081 [Bifidobacterium choerinum]
MTNEREASDKWMPTCHNKTDIDPHGVVLNDVRFSSPSQAGAFATGHASNGWAQWKTKEGNPIDQFRTHGD